MDSIIAEIPAACANEDIAVEFMEKQRWGDNPACAHCGSDEVYKMKSRDGGRNRLYRWRCRSCKKQYTVRHSTVFQDSPIPLHVWCYAFWRACSSKKGISALQIKRETGLSYKSALFMMHRIRHAMGDTDDRPLEGVVEADETFVGGRPRTRGPKYGVGSRKHVRPKTPVMVMLERNGSARSLVLPSVTSESLRSAIREHVRRDAILVTDECQAYKRVGKEQTRGHYRVNHTAREYARGDIYTNTAESYFAILKRGINGTFHAVSKKHLHRYVDEFSFRWNTRKDTDGARTVKAIRAAVGKRLMYREPGGSSE